MSFDAIEAGILMSAFCAGLLVLATHVPLGKEVLRRGIIFIDLAIAQFAGLGIVIAHMLGAAHQSWAMQAAAVSAALAGSALLRWHERHHPERQEAVIGVAFIVAASGAILLLAKDPHGSEHMKELLVGQILWTTRTDLLPLALLTFGVLAAWYGLRLRESPLGFYLLFAVAITASVQIVGVYLVFASLIVPALAAYGRPWWVGYAVGIAGYAAGLLASALFDLPSGAAIVVALALMAFIAATMPRSRSG